MEMTIEDMEKRIEERLPKRAVELVRALEAAGFEGYFVGGFIRDAILERDAYDIDITTDALWQEVEQVAHAHGFRTYNTGVKHGTITVTDPDAELSIEVTTYRVDGTYEDARHPDTVEFVSSLEEDLKRRDFTMNAIAFNPDTGIVDPLGGLDDIRNRIIRVVGDGKKRFAEDGLRILRGARFASQLGFIIEPRTYAAMVSNKHVLRNVSTERITHELDCLLLGDHVLETLMGAFEVISFVLPEIIAMRGCEQVTKYHIYDVYEHTAHVVAAAAPERLNRWVALCHDMGKPAAAFFDDDGVEHFYGHGSVSVEIARGMLRRLLMSPAFVDDVCSLVRFHDDEVAPTKRSVKKMLQKLGGRTDLMRALLDIKRADAEGQAPMCAPRIATIDEVEAVLDEVIAANEAFAVKDLAVSGSDLLAAGFEQGPLIGEALDDALARVIEEELPNEKDALMACISERYGNRR